MTLPDVDRASEADRDAGVEVEAVELVDQPDLVAVRGTRRAVGRRQGQPPTRDLAAVDDGGAVRRADHERGRRGGIAGDDPAVTSNAVNAKTPQP